MPGALHDVDGRRYEGAVADDVIGRREDGVGETSGIISDARKGRDELASGRVFCPTSPIGMEPSGLVFDYLHNDRKESGYLNASRLLATAGPHIYVFDNPRNLKEAIRSCRDKTLCSSSDTTELLRDEVIRLMQQDSSAASAFSCHAHIWEESDVSMSIQSDAKSEVSPPPVVLGIPSASREQEDVCMEESQTEESDGDDLDFSERHEAVEEHDVVEARQVQEDERAVEGRRDAKMRDGQCRREEHGNRGVEVAEASGASEALALAGFDGGKRPERHETHTTSNFSRARALGQMEGRNGNERRNERQASSIVVLSGWEANDMQAMLRAFPDTPWLFLRNESIREQAGDSTEVILELVSLSKSLSGTSNGVILAAPTFGPGAAARVLTRHFCVRVDGRGELRMAKIHAKSKELDEAALAETCPKVACTANTTIGGDLTAFDDVDHARCTHEISSSRTELSRTLLELAADSAKVLGGPFDTDWWQLSWDKDGNDSDTDAYTKISSSYNKQYTARIEKRGNAGSAVVEPGDEGHETEPEAPETVDEPWRKGLRRMVDVDSPLWMSSEVYSEPMAPFSCPDNPAAEYPKEWPLLDVLSNWNPANASSGVPPRHFLGTCRFDYQTELHKAQAYCLAEVPFIVYNVPALDEAVREWSDPLKLSAALRVEKFPIEVSASNRFLYHDKRGVQRPEGWTPPTRREYGTFDSWLLKALRPEHPRSNVTSADDGSGNDDQLAEREHYYFKLSHTDQRPFDFLARSLPFFAEAGNIKASQRDAPAGRRTGDRARDSFSSAPSLHTGRKSGSGRTAGGGRGRRGSTRNGRRRAYDGVRREGKRAGDHRRGGRAAGVNIFMRDPRSWKGIHCRIGMDGVMSEAHYDGSRNMVALLAGKRRWILSNPLSCDNMHMYRRGHPSARHTSADWTDAEVASDFPRLGKATANEVILRAGEALYVPEHWIHAIVNIGVSAQCNSRSGRSNVYERTINLCEARAHAGQ